jgi:hypothetical protein
MPSNCCPAGLRLLVERWLPMESCLVAATFIWSAAGPHRQMDAGVASNILLKLWEVVHTTLVSSQLSGCQKCRADAARSRSLNHVVSTNDVGKPLPALGGPQRLAVTLVGAIVNKPLDLVSSGPKRPTNHQDPNHLGRLQRQRVAPVGWLLHHQRSLVVPAVAGTQVFCQSFGNVRGSLDRSCGVG